MWYRKSGWVTFPVFLVFSFISFLSLPGCSGDTGCGMTTNEPPTVWISSGPPEGSVSGYNVGFMWGGFDPDGKIDHYEYCITDNNGAFDPADTTGSEGWTRTGSTEGTFFFSADQPTGNPGDGKGAECGRSHTFFVRSVDDKGLSSIGPAYRSFTAATLAPDVKIIGPGGGSLRPVPVSSDFTIEWIATDYVDDYSAPQDPDAVSWILVPLKDHGNDWDEAENWIRNLEIDASEWSEWVLYETSANGRMSWTPPPLDAGQYVFAIRARDDAGAITPVFELGHNLLFILVHEGPVCCGPLFIVCNEFMGCVRTAVVNTPLTIIDFPAGLPLRFCFKATAFDYGGTVVGYRYGWDISDLNNPDEWDVDWTPFPPSPPGQIPSACIISDPFYWGVHVLTIEVKDSSGYVSRIEVKLNIVGFTMGKPLLLVDDFDEGAMGGWTNLMGKGVLPNDEEHDAFWEDMLSDVADFTPTSTREGGDVMEVQHGEYITLPELADYKSVIWSANGHIDQQSEEAPVLYDLIRFRPPGGDQGGGGKRQPNLIALFMVAGGQMMFCGNHPVSQSIDKTYCSGLRYPVMFNYELDFRYGDQGDLPDPDNPCCDESFAYKYLCLETMEFAWCTTRRRRTTGLLCDIYDERSCPTNGLRDHTMRHGIPLDLYYDFPTLELRPETAEPGKYHAPDEQGLDVEVYNAQYFIDLCGFVRSARDCFTPIYGLGCLDTNEPVYEQPVAFWTAAYEDPGRNVRRSVVFGFPPVMFKPDQSRQAIEQVLFGEWQLLRKE